MRPTTTKEALELKNARTPTSSALKPAREGGGLELRLGEVLEQAAWRVMMDQAVDRGAMSDVDAERERGPK